MPLTILARSAKLTSSPWVPVMRTLPSSTSRLSGSTLNLAAARAFSLPTPSRDAMRTDDPATTTMRLA